MEKTKLVIGIWGLAGLLFSSPISVFGFSPPPTPGSQEAAKPRREPIRVGGNVQESKLISRVEPVYPEQAKAARVSGVVILQATINEEGQVADAKVLRGHPLLDEAAVDAVKQWRYAPTHLNGEPIPVVATVTVIFNLSSGGPSYSITMDEDGVLRDPSTGLEGDALVQKLKGAKTTVLIVPSPKMPFQALEQRLSALQKEGIENLDIRGAYFLHRGRLYCQAGGLVEAPDLALDLDKLADLAKQSGQMENATPGSDGRKMIIYQAFMNEIGELVAIKQMRGPKIPEIEAELARIRVITPGHIGSNPVPVAFYVEIPVP